MKGTSLALRAFLLISPVIVLAFANTATLRAHWNLDNLGTSRRYWEDLTVAFSLYETRDWGPTQTLSISDAAAVHVNLRLRELVPKAALRADVRPWEFWRTVQFRGFVNIAPFELRFSDDTGRARLSALGFRGLSGIAPYLPLWLPFLAFVPLAFWTMAECLRCGEGWAGALFLILISSSAYLLEALTLPYSAAGFHLLAALTLVPLSFFAFGPTPTRPGLWWRAAVIAIAIHTAAWCRSSCIVFLPGAAVLLLMGLFRVEARSSLARRMLLALVMLAILAAPKVLAPPQAHELWIGMWEGLGDFDREHGHAWSDPAARLALDKEGYVMEKRGPYWTEETEGIFRRLVLQDLTAYPGWYAKILIRRVVATVTQSRLWPTAQETGLSYRPAQHAAEGFVETYYNFVTTADGFTFLGRRWEAPLWLFWVAGIAFLGSAFSTRTDTDRRRLGVFLSFGLSALLMPVAVTTLSGIEAQVIVLGYLLCAAFLAADLGRALRRKLG